MGKSKEGYVRVGDVLREALVEDIDAIEWDIDRRAQAERVKASLQVATPHRGGYLVDTSGWNQADHEFLRMELDSVYSDQGQGAKSRGIAFGNTPIGRQIRALRETL